MNKREFKVLIRADGSKEIGMGHIMRTSTIAEELKEYAEIEYASLEGCQQGIDYIRNKGYKVNIIKQESALDDLKKIKANLIITDNYSIDKKYISQIKKTFKLVGYIDDDNNKSFEADFIINQNFNSEKLKYKVNKDCRLFLGSRYVLLREEFRNLTPIAIKNYVENVFITVGGGDPNNWMNIILEEVCTVDINYHVIIGPGFPHEKELISKYKGCQNIIFYQNKPIGEIMHQCDLAISTCGSTLYELGSMGIPVIGISVADNQIPIARRMQEAGHIKYLGDMRYGLNMSIKHTMNQLIKDTKEREEMCKKNILSINSNGVSEIRDYIVEQLRFMHSI